MDQSMVGVHRSGVAGKRVMSPRSVALSFAVALFWAASAGMPAWAEDSAAEGKKVYETYCVVCHGPKGDGKGLIGIVHRAQRNGVVVR